MVSITAVSMNLPQLKEYLEYLQMEQKSLRAIYERNGGATPRPERKARLKWYQDEINYVKILIEQQISNQIAREEIKRAKMFLNPPKPKKIRGPIAEFFYVVFGPR